MSLIVGFLSVALGQGFVWSFVSVEQFFFQNDGANLDGEIESWS